MARIHVALQDGFDDDRVIIKVAGRAVFDKEHVSTRRQIGLADTVEVDSREDSPTIEVTLPKRGSRAQHVVNIIESPYIGVSIVRDTIRFEESATPFGYI